MKRFILPLVTLAFLAGACSLSAKSTRKLSPESIGTVRTAWGVLPTYHVSGQRFTFARWPRLPASGDSSALKSVTLDVLVNADGSVKDATVTMSGGDPVTDFAALASFIGARYSLQPGDDYPAPFVVQQTITFAQESEQTTGYTDPFGPIGRQRSMPPEGSPFSRGPGGGWGP